MKEIKQKLMRFDIIVRKDGKKNGLAIKQEQTGQWDVLEEIGVIEVLKQRAYEKLNKLALKDGGK